MIRKIFGVAFLTMAGLGTLLYLFSVISWWWLNYGVIAALLSLMVIPVSTLVVTGIWLFTNTWLTIIDIGLLVFLYLIGGLLLVADNR